MPKWEIVAIGPVEFNRYVNPTHDALNNSLYVQGDVLSVAGVQYKDINPMFKLTRNDTERRVHLPQAFDSSDFNIVDSHA